MSSGKTHGQMSHRSPAFNTRMSTCVARTLRDLYGPGVLPWMNRHVLPVVERVNPDGEKLFFFQASFLPSPEDSQGSQRGLDKSFLINLQGSPRKEDCPVKGAVSHFGASLSLSWSLLLLFWPGREPAASGMAGRRPRGLGEGRLQTAHEGLCGLDLVSEQSICEAPHCSTKYIFLVLLWMSKLLCVSDHLQLFVKMNHLLLWTVLDKSVPCQLSSALRLKVGNRPSHSPPSNPQSNLSYKFSTNYRNKMHTSALEDLVNDFTLWRGQDSNFPVFRLH